MQSVLSHLEEDKYNKTKTLKSIKYILVLISMEEISGSYWKSNGSLYR